MLDVCLLGTSGMMPLPNRFLTSLMFRYNGSSMLIDCGEGTQVSIRMKGWSVHDIDIICITHFHGDHVSGLPGLLLSMGNSNRTEPVIMVGPKGLEKIVSHLRVIAPELPFDIKFIEISKESEELILNGYRINAFKLNHNVPCLGYSVDIDRNGRFMPEKALEYNIPQKYWSRLQKGETIEEDGVTFTPDMVLGGPRKGIKVTYCTDTRPVDNIVEHAMNSDLFICEGMYGEKDMIGKAREHKHMTFYEAATMAKRANVSQLWLTHFSPSVIKPESYLEEVKKEFSNTVIPKDRRSVVLEFDKNE